MNLRPLYDRIVVKRRGTRNYRAESSFPNPPRKSRRREKSSPSATARGSRTANWLRST